MTKMSAEVLFKWLINGGAIRGGCCNDFIVNHFVFAHYFVISKK